MRCCGPADSGAVDSGQASGAPFPVSRDAKPQPVRRCGDSEANRFGGLHRWIGNGQSAVIRAILI
jgi:hypothetical protein